MSVGRPVLAVGDRVGFDGGEHQVVGLAGTSVRLRDESGGEQVVLAGHLMAAADFVVLNSPGPVAVEPFGLLESLPAEVVGEAERWRDHVVEVMTGLPPGAAAGAVPRPGYDPATTSLADRQRAKAAELGVAFRTIEGRRARYTAQGLWGLVDQRAARTFEVAGQADARLVEVLRELIAAETDASTGTRSRLIRRAGKRVEELHGPGVVPLPGKTAFYALIDRLTVGRHTFGSAVTRRQTANRPSGAFTATVAARPGEQVQIDSTPIDVMVLAADGVPVRADLTIAVDVATRTICAAVLRPVGTKAVDASLLLAKMLVPEPMRPGWSQTLAMSASRLPFQRLVAVDARMREAAARPVIVPEQVVIDHGKVFVSETFTRACERLGISIQPARKHTPTDKAVVEATFSSIKTLFAQHVAGYKGANSQQRGRDVTAEWSLDQLQDLLDEWLIVGWAHRPHEGLRDPHAPRRTLTPNERYTALVAVAGYLPVTLTGTDYLELLPVKWRAINDYGIRIDHRTYDAPELGAFRRQHSGLTGKRGLWEVHYDPYDLSQVHVRTSQGWVHVPWTHRAIVTAPFADFTWRHARSLAHQASGDTGHEVTEAEIARALDALLTRAEHGPDKTGARVAARTRTATATHRPRHTEPADAIEQQPGPGALAEGGLAEGGQVIPFGVFDADAEAETWL
ncbi:Mu transposase C-terminal domain-containing protein [Actinokineospora cianjurensis]|uniref:Mu transposase C-terminal domain-containing protein n=1 Tax=Actinokineospora cianjurensis TaxID=585224 RepID=UPI001B869903|nr:Mu transposase C-terminal domain-containing protein [Actinokineospora cianjurensis]